MDDGEHHELASLPCGCRTTADDRGTMHIWPCCDDHGAVLAETARQVMPDVDVDIEVDL